MTSDVDTIAALSTAVGDAGIAVVRLSGNDAFAIAADVFRAPDGTRRETFDHRRLYHGRVVSREDVTLDEVVLGAFRAPESYTGEDVVEVSCHGGTVTVVRLLDRLYQAGARPAQPGEFTRRAFLNGKMDLIQAEAVADIIHARTDLQQRAAQRQLEGGLSETIGAMADATLALLSEIEANIDFIEEGIAAVDWKGAIAAVDDQLAALERLLESAPLVRPFREGYTVAIAGPVNAGKSSLFNSLAGEERAIVTDIPGTTRDVLREPVGIGGLLFVFQDTAGMRHRAGDEVEEIGMNLAATVVRDADVVLFVIDGSREPGSDVITTLAKLEEERRILVLNKSDLGTWPGFDEVSEQAQGGRTVRVSARTGEGIESLRALLVEAVGGETLSRLARERFVLNARLVTLMTGARESAGVLRTMLADRQPLELLAVQAREVLAHYEEATGRRYQDDLLDVIFSRFCLGK